MYPIKRNPRESVADLLQFLQSRTQGQPFAERGDDIDAEIAAIVKAQQGIPSQATPVPAPAVSAVSSRGVTSSESKVADFESENKAEPMPTQLEMDGDPFDTSDLDAEMADLMKAAGLGRR